MRVDLKGRDFIVVLLGPRFFKRARQAARNLRRSDIACN